MIDPGRAFRLAAAAVVVAGILARLALAATVWGRPLEDPDLYLPLARSLADGHGLTFGAGPTAYRPPLYPLLLVAGIWLEGPEPRAWALGLNVVLGGLTVALAGLAAWRWNYPRRAILAAMILVAFDPVLVSQGRAVMTETLAAGLVAGTLAAIGRTAPPRWAFLAGLVGGLGALCRPSLLPGVALMGLLVAVGAPGTLRPRMGKATVMAAGVGLVLLPWGVRNWLCFGEPVVSTTHGGYTFALANNEVYYAEVLHGPANAVWSGPNQREWFKEINQRCAGPTEPASDRLYYAEGWRVARERPGDFVRASVARLGRFWAVAPAAGVYGEGVRALTFLWTVPFWGLVVWSIARGPGRGWPAGLALAAVVGLAVVHAVYWTDMRMRAPIVPALALVAAAGLGRNRPLVTGDRASRTG
jgi:hypothetical protein